MSEETINLRLDSLEESRREQIAVNTRIAESLNRIELQLSSTIAKACPLPGHCRVLETEIKTKWEGDRERFERLEKRAGENDAWHLEMAGKMDGLRTVINRGLGALGLLTIAMPVLTWFVITHLVNK
jgi:hypothetical protein